MNVGMKVVQGSHKAIQMELNCPCKTSKTNQPAQYTTQSRIWAKIVAQKHKKVLAMCLAKQLQSSQQKSKDMDTRAANIKAPEQPQRCLKSPCKVLEKPAQRPAKQTTKQCNITKFRLENEGNQSTFFTVISNQNFQNNQADIKNNESAFKQTKHCSKQISTTQTVLVQSQQCRLQIQKHRAVSKIHPGQYTTKF